MSAFHPCNFILDYQPYQANGNELHSASAVFAPNAFLNYSDSEVRPTNHTRNRNRDTNANPNAKRNEPRLRRL